MTKIKADDHNRDTGFGQHAPLHKVLPALGDPRPVSVAVKKLTERLEAGDVDQCPCCAQTVKLYQRKLGSVMAKGLILLYHRANEMATPGPIHITEYFQSLGKKSGVPSSALGGGDVSKLRYWKLLRRVMGERADGSNRVGLYTMTDLGRAFVRGLSHVPSHVHLYNGIVVGWSDTTVDVHDALGKKFNYRELMSR